MPATTPKQADDMLRARDAQTVVSLGVDVGPHDDDRIEREAAVKRAAGRSSATLVALIVVAAVVVAALALFAL